MIRRYPRVSKKVSKLRRKDRKIRLICEESLEVKQTTIEVVVGILSIKTVFDVDRESNPPAGATDDRENQLHIPSLVYESSLAL